MSSLKNMPKHLREAYAARFEPEGAELLAELYWRIALLVGCCLIVGALAYGVWVLTGALAELGAAPAGELPTPPPTLDPAALQAFVQQYSDRQSRFESLQATPPPPVADPSE